MCVEPNRRLHIFKYIYLNENQLIAMMLTTEKEPAHVDMAKTYFEELDCLELQYPGWEKDYAKARDAFRKGQRDRFIKMYRNVQAKKRLYEDYQVITRLKDLKKLQLKYPGYKKDMQKLKAWNREHPPNAESNALFQDKLHGLENKNNLYFGNRSHEHLIELDNIIFSYPGWEIDYEVVINAHCTAPEHLYPDAIHRMKEKENVYHGNRRHWRLRALDSLHFTYQNFEEDRVEIENWHLNNTDSPTNLLLFRKKIERMRNQEKLHLERKDKDSRQETNESAEEDVKQSKRYSKVRYHNQRVSQESRVCEYNREQVAKKEISTKNEVDTIHVRKVQEVPHFREGVCERRDSEEVTFENSIESRSYERNEETNDSLVTDGHSIKESVIDKAISASLKRIKARRKGKTQTQRRRYERLTSPEITIINP